MQIKITAPSKTFLLGEYIALTGGPTLLICTEQRFALYVSGDGNDIAETLNFHSQSPAAKLITENSELLKNYKLNFVDPYLGRGGLGASSAQFLLTMFLINLLKKTKLNAFEILANYHKFVQTSSDLIPSGADVIAQLTGDICFFYKNESAIHSMKWPFPHLSFCLLRTGIKVATHEHLSSLSSYQFDALDNVVLAGLKSLQLVDQKGFIDAINNYAEILQKKGLIIESTQSLVKLIIQQNGVLAAKGCGALGADIIFVLLQKNHLKKFLDWAVSQQLPIVYQGQETSRGVTIELGD